MEVAGAKVPALRGFPSIGRLIGESMSSFIESATVLSYRFEQETFYEI
jgi:hypothetical protein